MILQRKSTTSEASVKSVENSLTQTLHKFNAFQTHVISPKMRLLTALENAKPVMSSSTQMSSVRNAFKIHALKTKSWKPLVNAQLAQNILTPMNQLGPASRIPALTRPNIWVKTGNV